MPENHSAGADTHTDVHMDTNLATIAPSHSSIAGSKKLLKQ